MIRHFFIGAFFLFQIILFGQNSEVEDLRRIVSAKISNDGILNWTTDGEGSTLPFVIEQFRWNKWIKIGEINGVGTPTQNEYSFKTIPYSGENLVRVSAMTGSALFKEVKWKSEVTAISCFIKKGEKEIKFSNGTMYEIIDSSGKLIKRGFGESVSREGLPKGTYTLNYDNTTTEFKL